MDGEGEWNITFYFLRIPNSMTERFTNNFTAQIQASDSDSVNNAIDAVGFDFIRPPKVEFEVKNNRLIINNFSAEARIKGKYEYIGFEAFSMLLVDYSYDARVFSVDEVYYHDDFVENSIVFPTEKIEKQAMLVFIDKFGNEYRTIIGG